MAQHWKMQGGNQGDYVARVLSGGDEHCAFCAALASLGFIHQDEAPPEFWKFHNGCGCVMVSAPDPNTTIEGADYSEYREAYEACKVEGDLKATLKAIRENYPWLVRDGVKQVGQPGDPKIDDILLRKITHGIPGTTKGGHLHGRTPVGKKERNHEFPPSWTEQTVKDAFEETLRQGHRDPSGGSSTTITHEYKGVQVILEFNTNARHVEDTVKFRPLSGAGVVEVRYIKGKRKEKSAERR